MKNYGQLPAISADEAYDAAMLLFKAIAKCGTQNPDCISQDIISTKNYSGASGTFSFDQNGQIQKEFMVKTIKDGQFIELE